MGIHPRDNPAGHRLSVAGPMSGCSDQRGSDHHDASQEAGSGTLGGRPGSVPLGTYGPPRL